jgi:GGDEF domain-containing protein
MRPIATEVKPWERSAVVRPQAGARAPGSAAYDPDPDPDTRNGFGDLRRALAAELAREADTLLLTRGSFEKLLDALLLRARQRRTAIGLVGLFFEDWKALSERGGEAALMRAFAELMRDLRRRSRTSDEIGRVAEAQIALILPGCEPPDLTHVGTRIRLALEGRELGLGAERIRISAGGAELLASPRSGNPGAAQLLAELENLLEAARAAGG